MKCLSLNCRGMASASNKLALWRLFENEPIDIIMLQETLGNAKSINQTLFSINLGWHFHSLDTMGRSGGVTIRYNPLSINVLATWGGVGLIRMDLVSVDLSLSIRIINVYGPCQQREKFW